MKVKDLLNITEHGTDVRIQFNIYNYSTCIQDEAQDMKDVAGNDLLEKEITSVRAGNTEIIIYVEI